MKLHKLNIPKTELISYPRDIAYYTYGDESNKNIIFCAHGLSRNASDFHYVANALKDTHQVIAIDITGRAGSDWLNSRAEYNYNTYLHDVKILFDELGISEVKWLGTSMGGLLAMHFNKQFPGIISKFFINDVGPAVPVKIINKIYRYVGQEPIFDNMQQASDFMRKKLTTFGIREEEHWQHVIKNSVVQKDDGKILLNYDPKIIPCAEDIKAFQHLEYIEDWTIWDNIDQEVMLFRGLKSDLLNDDIINRMLENKNLSTIVNVPDVGHAPMLMEDEQIEYVYNWFNGFKLPNKWL